MDPAYLRLRGRGKEPLSAGSKVFTKEYVSAKDVETAPAPDLNRCEARISNEELYPRSFQPRRPFRRQEASKNQVAYSKEGLCGPNNGNTLCDPESKADSGGCCSQYGWVSG